MNKIIIDKTIEFVKSELNNAESGHGWWHIDRVWNNSIELALDTEADIMVVELAALLHDIADHKIFGNNTEQRLRKTENFLSGNSVPYNTIKEVINIIENIGFSNSDNHHKVKSLEFNIVSDADMLDAIGAVGIARTFSYGGYKNREIYNPEIEPEYGMTKEQYKKHESPTINHFYEKLLSLKELIKTDKGKIMAEERHKFMLTYLEQFYKECHTKGFTYKNE